MFSNDPPVVDAGADQTITLPAQAVLDATATDDGLPGGTLTTTWSQQSGPGTATFDDAAAVDTNVTFTTSGIYVPRLTADDSQATTFDEVIVTADPVRVCRAICRHCTHSTRTRKKWLRMSRAWERHWI